MHVKRTATIGAITILLVAAMAVVAATQEFWFGYEDPMGLQYTAVIDEEGNEIEFWVEEVPEEWIAFDRFPEEGEGRKLPEYVARRPERIHPLLWEWYDQDPGRVVPAILTWETFGESPEIPRFPELNLGMDRASAGGLDEEIQGVINELWERQAELTFRFLGDLGLDLPIVDQFWLISGFVTELPLELLPWLAEEERIAYVQPQFAGEEPPQDGNASNDVDDGRRRIVSDPYYSAVSHTGSYIGLLDTGVRSSHRLFTNPSHLDYLFDCMTSTCCCSFTATGCNTGDVYDHGTSSAAIIVGNDRYGNAHRGVTQMTLDSFRIYDPYLDSAAAVRAFQCAIKVWDRVIVGEIQSSEGEKGAIAAAADAAYDAGAAIISANGNYGPKTETVASPGSAHKSIGVGAYDVVSEALMSYQGRGPTSDGRVKPDIQCPTNTETACRASDTCLSTFGGTSGSTPYAAGAAALVRRWLGGHGTWDPGSVYSFLINGGDRSWPSIDNNNGAGHLGLPVNGYTSWGKLAVNDGMVIDLKIHVSGGMRDLHAALWWPESRTELHDDVDLYLIDPNGTIRARSVLTPSVFEFAQVDGSLTPGVWTIRVKAFRMKSAPQTVYWTAAWHF